MRNTSAIILAAGFSRRMGQNKLLLPFRGRSLIAHTLNLVSLLPFCEVILVTTAPVIAFLQSEGEMPDGVKVCVNNTPEPGQSVSLRIGTEAASGEAYMYFTGDQPLLDKETVLAILARDTPGHIVVPRASRGPGSPVLFCSSFRQVLQEATGDAGGRHIREKHPELCLWVDVSDPLLLMDIDTPEQYHRLLALDAGGPA